MSKKAEGSRVTTIQLLEKALHSYIVFKCTKKRNMLTSALALQFVFRCNTVGLALGRSA